MESEHGDPFTLLNALDEWIQVRQTRQTSLTRCVRVRSLHTGEVGGEQLLL